MFQSTSDNAARLIILWKKWHDLINMTMTRINPKLILFYGRLFCFLSFSENNFARIKYGAIKIKQVEIMIEFNWYTSYKHTFQTILHFVYMIEKIQEDKDHLLSLQSYSA